MGDLLELKTSPRDQLNYYMISSDGLKFYLKGKGSAAIRLTTHPNEKPENWITIEKTCRRVDFLEKVTNVNMISAHTYKPFWISWSGKEVQVGKGDNPKPFLVQEKPIETINYISFSSPTHYSMYWKLRLPPKIKQPVYKKINDGQLKWVNMDDNRLPEGALIGGYENEVLYIMRAMHEQALTPGKFVPSKGAGYVAWGYDAHKKTDMEVLCGYNGIWIKSQYNEIPKGAIEGGYSEVNNEILYVGRSMYDGYLIPGKVQPSHRILCGYDGIWVPTEGDKIPAGALVGGYTEYGETMFVGRVRHNEVFIPGKIAPSHKILCGYDGKWVQTEGDRIPYGALVGGYTEYGETMFVCRELHNEVLIPGKIAPSHKVCYIPYNGKEIAKHKYEILMPLHSSRDENKSFFTDDDETDN